MLNEKQCTILVSVCVCFGWGGLFNLCSLGSLRLAIGWSEGMKYFALKIAIAVALSCPRQTERDQEGPTDHHTPWVKVSRSNHAGPFRRHFHIRSVNRSKGLCIPCNIFPAWCTWLVPFRGMQAVYQANAWTMMRIRSRYPDLSKVCRCRSSTGQDFTRAYNTGQ